MEFLAVLNLFVLTIYCCIVVDSNWAVVLQGNSGGLAFQPYFPGLFYIVLSVTFNPGKHFSNFRATLFSGPFSAIELPFRASARR